MEGTALEEAKRHRLSCHHEPALKGLFRNCKTKEWPQIFQTNQVVKQVLHDVPFDAPSVCYAVSRGERIAKQNNYQLVD